MTFARTQGLPLRIASALAFSLLLASFPSDAFLPIAPMLTMLWLALLFPRRLTFILGTGSLLELFLAARTTGITHFQVMLLDVPARWLFLSGEGRHAPGALPGLAVKVAGFAAFSAVAWFFFNRSPRWMRARVAPLSLAILLILLGLFGAIKDARPLLAYFLLVLAFLWVKLMWGFVLAMKMGLGFKPFPFRHVWSLSPAWKFDVLPNWVPSRVDLHTESAASRKAEGAPFLLTTATLAAIAWAYRFASPYYYEILPSWTGLGSILFLERVPNVAAAWAYVFCDFLIFLAFGLGVVLSIAFLFLELVGIPASASVTSPHLSRSFHEFNTRILRFYIQMVTEVAYAPFARVLNRFLPYGKLRVSVGTFLAVLIVGVLYHFLSFLHLVALLGLGVSLRLFLTDQLPYVTVFALASAVSVAFAMRRRPASLPPWQHGLRLAAIVVFNSLLLSLAFNAVMDDPASRLRVLRFLFTGIR